MINFFSFKRELLHFFLFENSFYCLDSTTVYIVSHLFSLYFWQMIPSDVHCVHVCLLSSYISTLVSGGLSSRENIHYYSQEEILKFNSLNYRYLHQMDLMCTSDHCVAPVAVLQKTEFKKRGTCLSLHIAVSFSNHC